MMKNGPGSPGSICKNFGKVFKIKRMDHPYWDNISIFEDILQARYPLMHPEKVKYLVICTQGDFLLFIFMITLYQNQDQFNPQNSQWDPAINAIFEVASSNFPEFVNMDFDEFCIESQSAYSTLIYYM